MGRILVGTASWTDKSLIKSGWYPEGATSAEGRLKHGGHVDGVALVPQATLKERRHAGLVFNNENSHAATVRPSHVISV
jgi:hypothetical protein